MRFKPGVVMWRMHWRIEGAMHVIDQVTRDVCGRDAIITSARDGEHSANSLHYEGKAIDLRTRDLDDDTQADYRLRLAASLLPSFDVVLESDHIHVEWDA